VALVRPDDQHFNPVLPRAALQVAIITPAARCFATANTPSLDANDPSPSAAPPTASW
jgi:hypothetical protein